MRKISKCIFFAVGFWGTERLCHLATDGFTLSKIASDLPIHIDEQAPPPHLADIFSQRFVYLTKGGQCYVFVSEDGNYVLKFFKHHHLRAPAFYQYLPFLRPHARKKQAALKEAFASHQIACRELKKETGLVYLHLEKNRSFPFTVKIVDKLHIEHPLPLGLFEFVLQKRATLLYSHIDALMQKGDVEGAKQALAQALQLIQTCRQKGILDTDANLSTNFGFIEGEAIQIDTGRLSKPTPFPDYRPRGIEEVKHWLNSHYPELTEFFTEHEQNISNPI